MDTSSGPVSLSPGPALSLARARADTRSSPGSARFGGDQLREEGGQLPLHALVLRALVVGRHGDRDPRAVGWRNAEQLAQHRDREGASVLAEQVGDVTGRRRHHVQQAGGDFLRTWPQLRDAAQRECLLHQPASAPG